MKQYNESDEAGGMKPDSEVKQEARLCVKWNLVQYYTSVQNNCIWKGLQ